MKIAMGCSLALLIASSDVAQADFGQAGTTAIEARSELRLGATEVGDFEDKLVRLEIGGGHFVADRASVGARFLVEYEKSASAMYGVSVEKSLGVGIGGGLVRQLRERAFLWLQGGIGVARSGHRWDVDAESSVVSAAIQVQAPFYYQPIEHLMIGLGPAFSVDVYRRGYDGDVGRDRNKHTVVELVGSVAGWW